MGLEGMQACVVPTLVLTAEWTVAWANAAAERLAGVGEGAFVGEDILEHLDPEDRPAAVAAFVDVGAAGGPITTRFARGHGIARGPGGAGRASADHNGVGGPALDDGRWLAGGPALDDSPALDEPALDEVVVDLWVAQGDDGTGNRVCHLVEVTHHAHALQIARSELVAHRSDASLSSAQSRTLELIALGEGLEEALKAVCAMIESQQDQLRSAVLVLEADRASLRVGAAPNVAQEFWRLLGSAASPETASAGRAADGPFASAAHSAAATWSEDLASDDRWRDWGLEAVGVGLRSLYCSAIVGASGEVLGALAFFWGEPHRIVPSERRLFEAGSGLAAVAIERSIAEAAMAEAATHDPLTGLPNRSLFLDRLRLALARGRRSGTQVAVLFLDLDRFKVVNDSLGHSAGDRLLVTAANRLVRAVRPGDTVARFGGDEFTVLCEEVDDADVAQRLGERLARELRRPFVVAHRRFYVTASIGIALGESGSRPQELLRDADVAMYRGKERGRNRIELFDRSLRVRTLRRLQDESALRAALDGGELPLHYQPILELASGRPIGVETLLRWQRSDGDAVAPADMVALAEESGLIHSLGARTLEQAGAQVGAWVASGLVGPDFLLAVNLSPAQLTDSSLVETVKSVLAANSMLPGQVCLELKESSLIDDQPETAQVLGELHRLGVLLAIDDFGAGWSSIARLRTLPVEVLKIDRSFVASPTEPKELALFESVVGLARALDMAVIVEGVETPEQLRVARDLHCWAAQGYHLGRPAGAGATAETIDLSRSVAAKGVVEASARDTGAGHGGGDAEVVKGGSAGGPPALAPPS